MQRTWLILLLAAWALVACKPPAEEKEEPKPDPQVPQEVVEDDGEAEEPSTKPEVDTAEAPEVKPDEADAAAPKDVADAESNTAPEVVHVGKTGEGPLNATTKALFFSSPEDPPTEHLFGINEEFEGRHYIYGDEYNLHLFYPHIKDLGGGYAGVGADQAYIYIGWQRPDIAWLVDYDDWVILIHQAYKVFFLKAETPKDFLYYWSTEGEEKALKLLDKELAEHPRLDEIKKLFQRNRGGTRYRIDRLLKTFEELQIPSVFHTQETYDFVRTMYQEERMRPMLANLLDDEGLIGIGESSRNLDVPLRVLYLSNAEEYWNYSQQYRDNITNLHFDEQSVVLRTLSTWTRNKDYQYCKQAALNYVGWLSKSWVVRVSYIVQRVKSDDVEEVPFIEVTTDIAEAERRRQARKERQKR